MSVATGSIAQPAAPTAAPPKAPPDAALPYAPWMARLLRPLQRAFLVLNRCFMAPALKAGLGRFIGNPVTGHLMLLRTRGWMTGLVREAPLGYVILDGDVYCVAGYGRTTPWYRNLYADPGVEVTLPDRSFHGTAEPVEDPAEWLRAYRALIVSFGLLGRAIRGDIRALDDKTLLEVDRSLPIVRIRPTDPPGPIVAGPWDPGGSGWLAANTALLGLAAAWYALRRIVSSRSRGPRSRPRIDK